MFSIGMMVKNEGEYLRFCLDNLKLTHRGFIVIDTGSTDMTKSILEQCNIQYSEVAFTNYSEIRNMILDKSLSRYVLMLDGDETIVDEFIECEFTKKGYILNRCHYLGQGCLYFDQTLRLLHTGEETTYKNDIFESVNFNQQDIEYVDVLIHHFGYLKSTFLNKVLVNLPIIQRERIENDRSVLYSMEALYLILQGKVEDALEVINYGSCRYENVWFLILKADICKAQKKYKIADSILDEALAFCQDTMTATACRFYVSRIYLKKSILKICQKEYDKAREILEHVDGILKYGRLINEKIINEKIGDYERAMQIGQELKIYPFENIRNCCRSCLKNISILSDVYSDSLI